jgi:hypothetical protein
MKQCNKINIGPFEVDDMGNVTKNGVEFPAKINMRGQHYLYINGKLCQLSRIVYEHFVDHLWDGDFVKHIDSNKSNCAASNLYAVRNRRSQRVESKYTGKQYPDLKTACEAERYSYSTELYRLRNCPHRSMFERV